MQELRLTRRNVRSAETHSFLGQVVSADGVKPDQSKVEVVLKVIEPEDVSSLRRFLGMVNQLGKFIPKLSEVIEPQRQLPSQKNSWY